MSRRSLQDPGYQAEYEAFCQTREQAQLPYVSYRNFLRQWRRSVRAHGEDVPSYQGHSKRAAGHREREGGKGSGGVTPPPPPPPSRKRQTGNEDGGVAPPTVKAKSGDSPYQSLLARPDMKLLGHRYKRWDIRVFHTKTLGVPVAFRI